LSKEYEPPRFWDFSKELIRTCLAEESLEKRVFGVYVIRGILQRVEQLHTVDRMDVARWVKELGLINGMFVASPHVELIQRMSEIILLLLECGEFGVDEMEVIWSVLLSSQHRTMNQGLPFACFIIGIFQIFSDCSSHFSLPALDLLIDKCRKLFLNNLPVLDEGYMVLLRCILVALSKKRLVYLCANYDRRLMKIRNLCFVKYCIFSVT
jgi:hypothetical protein